MAFWYGQKCGLGKVLSVTCWAGEIAQTSARKSFYICLPQSFTRFSLCCLNTTSILMALFYVKKWRCLPFMSKGNDEFLGADAYSKDLTWVWHDFHCFLWTFLFPSFPRPTSPTTMIFGLCCNLFMLHSRNLRCTSRLKMSVSLVCFSSVAGLCTTCTRTTNSQRCLACLRKG